MVVVAEGEGGIRRGEVSPQRMSLWKESYCCLRERIVPQQVICDPLAHPCVKASFYFLFSLDCNTSCCFSHWGTVVHGRTQSEACHVGPVSCLLHSHIHTRTVTLSELLQELDIDSWSVSFYCSETVKREVIISL